MTSRRAARAALRMELSASDVPDHIRYLRMEQYRDVVRSVLERHPGDVFRAGLAVFYVWCGERHAFEREHGIDGQEQREVRAVLLGGLHGPDFVWICREFGLREQAPRWMPVKGHPPRP